MSTSCLFFHTLKNKAKVESFECLYNLQRQRVTPHGSAFVNLYIMYKFKSTHYEGCQGIMIPWHASKCMFFSSWMCCMYYFVPSHVPKSLLKLNYSVFQRILILTPAFFNFALFLLILCSIWTMGTPLHCPHSSPPHHDVKIPTLDECQGIAIPWHTT